MTDDPNPPSDDPHTARAVPPARPTPSNPTAESSVAGEEDPGASLDHELKQPKPPFPRPPGEPAPRSKD